jgi:hypothetical protein
MWDILNALSRLWAIHSIAVSAASLGLALIGGLMYVGLSVTTSETAGPVSKARKPGWLAARRARRGIRQSHGRIGVGYRSGLQQAYLTERELAHHGALFGGPGSGKTTFLQLLIEASAGRMPVVVLDPKGSPVLANTVRALGGLVWTLDGTLAADLLDPRPWQVPDLLLEARTTAPTRGCSEMRRINVLCGRRGHWRSKEIGWICGVCKGCSTERGSLLLYS